MYFLFLLALEGILFKNCGDYEKTCLNLPLALNLALALARVIR